MRRVCEVCVSQGFSSHEPGARYVVLEDRVISLCERHAAELDAASVRSLDEMTKLFRESSGRRSELPRRSPLNRRAFPPRPEGRRTDDERRNLG
jgi:hypothetical protein